MLIPVTIVAALYAPLVFLGGFWAILVGVSLWGWGWACRRHSSRQRSPRWFPGPPVQVPGLPGFAYSLFTGIYGTAWVLGSIVIGVLADVSLDGLVAFCIVTELARSAHPDGPQADDHRALSSAPPCPASQCGGNSPVHRPLARRLAIQ